MKVIYLLLFLSVFALTSCKKSTNETNTNTRVDAQFDELTNKLAAADFKLPEDFIQLWDLSHARGSPIRYDRTMNEFQIVYSLTESNRKTTETILLKYCPFTGARLPDSRRGNLFFSTSSNELAHILTNVSKYRSFEDIYSTFGRPNSVFNTIDGQQWVYTNISPKGNVLFQSSTSAGVRVIFTPKLKF